MSRKIAIGSTDGVNIDTHFGKTEVFHIFEIPEDGEPSLIEKRAVQKPADGGSHANLEGIIEKLSDVEAVLAKQIGSHAADLLAAEGITSASIRCSVEQAAKRYAKRGKLLPPPISVFLLFLQVFCIIPAS
jgi:predicted Fe-Mo cluster-binding NifX family protein